MRLFLTSTPTWLVVEYLFAVGLFFHYLGWKLTKRGYLFSPYTIVVFTFAFTLFVCGPLAYNDAAWAVLGIRSASAYYGFLNKSIAINLAGFLLTLATMTVVESKHRDKIRPPLLTRLPQFSTTFHRRALLFAIAIFGVCLVVVGAVPLFGDRTIFDAHERLRPAYNFANFLVLVTTSILVVWSSLHRSRKYVFLVGLGLTCMLFTGGRTSLLSVVELVAMLYVYRRYKGRSLFGTAVLAASLAAVCVLGLFLAAFRTGSAFNITDVAQSAAYGNTFSDVRDGAFVLSGWERFDSEALTGRTYAAGLISFIPSGLSDFRTSWGWGYYTTHQLFGFDHHYGFRGGWSLEAYMNFGIAGVAIVAVLCGWLLGRLEASFYRGIIIGHSNDYPAAYAGGWLAYTFFTVLIASSATYNLYCILFLLLCPYAFRQRASHQPSPDLFTRVNPLSLRMATSGKRTEC